MKILWVGHFLPWPLRGGSLIRTYHLIREAARNNEVSFLGFNQRALLRTEAEISAAVEALLEFCCRVRALPITMERGPLARERIVFKSLFSGCYDEWWLASRHMAHALVEEWRRFKPDIIHFDTIGMFRYRSLFAAQATVLNHHNIESHMMFRRAQNEERSIARAILLLQARRLQALETKSATRFDMHFTVSDLDRDRLVVVAPQARVEVVPNGVDIEYFMPPKKNCEAKPQAAIFVGGLNWNPNRKAVKWFLDEVHPLLLQRHPEYTFTIVGRDPPREVLAMARRDPQIIVTGEVEDVRPYVEKASVFVTPIREGGGTRLKVLNAIAQGIPLVATSVAVEGINVRNGVHALLADDAIGFAQAVGLLFRDVHLRKAISRAGRELVVREFSWEVIGRQLKAAYETVAACKGERPCAE